MNAAVVIPPDTLRRIVLRRAAANRLFTDASGGQVFDTRRALGVHLAPAVPSLLADGHLHIVQRGYPAGPSSRLFPTESGAALLSELEAERCGRLKATRARLIARRRRPPTKEAPMWLEGAALVVLVLVTVAASLRTATTHRRQRCADCVARVAGSGDTHPAWSDTSRNL